MNTANSLAATFFESINLNDSQAFKQLSELVNNKSLYRESEWIEYKSGFYHDTQSIAPEWCKQLSGFANCGDGIVIWGIQTKKLVKSMDAPNEIVLVKEPLKLLAELEQLKTYSVEPPVHNVKIRAVLNDNGEGFVVALIPESNRKPHQVKLKNAEVQDRYYIRNGDTTEPIRQSLLRMLFYPQSRPRLSLLIDSISRIDDIETVEFYLKNTGIVSVSEMTLVVTDQGSDVYFTPNKIEFSGYQIDGDAVGFLAKYPLHPEYRIHLGGTVLKPDRRFMINIFGKDMRPFRWKILANRSGLYEINEVMEK